MAEMKTFTEPGEIREWSRAERAAGRRVALVPTMGALHAGHLSLIAKAREHAQSVAASVFVNPAQFGPGEDFEKYPRDGKRDAALLAEAGCDALFMPSAAAMYRPGASAFADESALARGFEGARRPGHFRGVCTVVAKLFNIVEPCAAVFGQKDFQQAAVIRRMARDLDFPVEIITAPTAREADGLAMSSRNAYLSPDERARAAVLCRALDAAEAELRAGAPAPGLERRLSEMISAAGLRVDYAAFADAETLEPLGAARRGAVLLLAAFCGETRLIDNRVL